MDLSNLKNSISENELYKKSQNLRALNSKALKSRGQPKKDEKSKLTAKFSLYLTKEEKEKIDLLAKQEMLSASNLVRKYLKQANKI